MTLIAIASAGTVDDDAVAMVESSLRDVIGVDTARVAPLPDIAYARDEARNQYSSTLVLRQAQKHRPPDAARMIILTERDIFIPMLSFVFGQAQLDGPLAVLSFARLRQEFYGLPPNHALFLVRVRKETLHEIGHTLGLTHCADTRCTMSLSTSIQQLDAKGSGFCENCTALVREKIPPARRAAVPEVSLEEALGNSGRRR